tara:strand:- start:289 stop:651 length:363 start_codon:yes stop_codon:yes gene_type:complete
MVIFFILIFFFSVSAHSGEIDGKGIICNVYGDTIGYFFDSDRAFEYKIAGGKEDLEIVKKDVGKYYTNENSIFINEIKINRKELKFQKYSSFRGDCEAYENFGSFKDGFNIDKLIEENKI